MAITHNFVSTKPPSADPTIVGSAEWNDAHAVTFGTGAGDIAEGNHLHTGVYGDISGTGVVGQVAEFVTDTKTLQAAKLIAPAVNILTITNNAASTLALNITASKTLTLTAANDYTLTIPATGTAALLATANVFTTTQTITPGTDVVGLIIDKPATADFLQLRSVATIFSYFQARGTLTSSLGTNATNQFFGFNCGNASTTATGNVALGWTALNAITNGGGGNVAIGQSALQRNTSGQFNFSMGTNTLSYNLTGADNVAIGNEALKYKAGGSRNIAIGSSALVGAISVTGYDNNIAIGYGAGQALRTGNENTFVGNVSGFYVTGSRNLFMGYAAGFRQVGVSDYLIINNRDLSSAATELTNSIIVGVMGDTPSVQTLALNAITKVAVNTTTNNAPLILFDLNAYVSTASTGFANGGGVGMTWTGETATDGTSQLMAAAKSVWVDATNATRKAKLQLSAYDTSIRTGLEIEATGSDVTLRTLGKVSFTQTDDNEYIDSLADGYMDYRATTAHRFGDGTNQLVISATGDVTLEGTAKYERHVQLDAKADGTVANQPTQIDFFTVGGLQFASVGAKYAFCQWEIPDDWDGTDAYIEIDWFPDSGATTGDDAVRWTVEYRSIAEGEAINLGTSVTVDNGVGGDTTDYAQYETKHTRFTLDFDNANQPMTAQDHMYFKISRDTSVANDFAGTVTVSAYEIIYNSKGLPTSN